MNEAPKKERYVIYVSPEVGEVIRDKKAEKRGNTFSDYFEQLVRRDASLVSADRLARSA